MLTFFDTETTGFYQDALAHDDPKQPRLVQIAAHLTHDDGEVAASISLIVNPGIKIPKQASDVHGITDDVATALGVKEETALGMIAFMAKRSSLIIAHNAKFDLNVMKCVAARTGQAHNMPEAFCTMEAASPIVNLPPTERMLAAGYNKPKPPKLEECIRHFFNEELTGAHDALVDVDACKRLYFHLKTLEA